MHIKPVFKTNKWPILVAGPCSAETEEQVLLTAEGLMNNDIDLFRAGIWKPRTRPGAFEGMGEKALPWLVKVKEKYGFKITTEVATAKHVELCLNAGVDVLWIGARTSVNPFSVQEVASALKGVDIPVLVKNPISPDLALWMGAVERLYRAGIDKIALVHRGFSTLDTSMYRNKPQWEIALEMRRRIPEIQIIVDPSHICGNRTNLLNIAQKALDLNYNGIMLETHPEPDEAWSDAKQQLKPEAYSELIKKLVLRNKSSKDLLYLEQLFNHRDNIDSVDRELIELIAERMTISEKIAQLKKEKNIVIFQETRYKKVLENALIEAKKHNLSPTFINHLISAIHEESINKQDAWMNQ